MSDDEKRLAELLLGIKEDKAFVLAMMSLAKQTDSVAEMADVIEECGIDDEHDLYDIIFGDSEENE